MPGFTGSLKVYVYAVKWQSTVWKAKITASGHQKSTVLCVSADGLESNDSETIRYSQFPMIR